LKINEIITEGQKVGAAPENIQHSSHGQIRFRDKGGYDRTYNLNRVMMAAAMSDGSGEKVDMDQSSWVEKYNLALPYTEEEREMMKSALDTVDSEYDDGGIRILSAEDSEVNTLSSVPARKKNKYGV
jgi:hypothetical protein